MKYNNYFDTDYQHDDAYLAIVSDLLVTPQVQLLNNYVQHHFKSRLDHSLAVSYVSYKLALKYGLDAVSVARAGLVHDLFYYDWRETSFELGSHSFIHPRVALRNAEKIMSLTSLEKDIILHHMFPSGGGLPQSREAWLVNFVDDWLAVREGVLGFVLKFKRSFVSN